MGKKHARDSAIGSRDTALALLPAATISSGTTLVPTAASGSGTTLVLPPAATSTSAGTPTLADYRKAKRVRFANRAALVQVVGEDAPPAFATGKWSRAEKQACEAKLHEALEDLGLATDSAEFLEGLEMRAPLTRGADEAPSLLNTGRRAGRGPLKKNFWVGLAATVNESLAVSGRPPRKWRAIYDWVHMRYLGAKGGQGGAWSEDDVQRLLAMRARGSRWRDIAEELGRYVQDVRCKWRAATVISRRGTWDAQEIGRLEKLVRRAVKVRAKDLGLSVKAAVRACAAGANAAGGTYSRGGAPVSASSRALITTAAGTLTVAAAPTPTPSPALSAEEVSALQASLPWTAIAEQLGGRSYKQCRQNWKALLGSRSAAAAAAGASGGGGGHAHTWLIRTDGPSLAASRAAAAASAAFSPAARLEEDLELVRAIHATGAEDDSEVSWNSLLPHLDSTEARRRLLVLARRIGFDGDSLGEGQLGEVVDRLLPLLEATRARLVLGGGAV